MECFIRKKVEMQAAASQACKCPRGPRFESNPLSFPNPKSTHFLPLFTGEKKQLNRKHTQMRHFTGATATAPSCPVVTLPCTLQDLKDLLLIGAFPLQETGHFPSGLSISRKGPLINPFSLSVPFICIHLSMVHFFICIAFPSLPYPSPYFSP